MSTIDFVVTDLVIRNTRSSHQDTNYIAVGIVKNDQMYSAQHKRLGDQNSGTHPVNLTVSIPSVYVGTDRFVLSYLVMNHGGDDPGYVDTNVWETLYGNYWNAFSPSDAQTVAAGNRILPSCMAYGAHGRNRDALWNKIKPGFQQMITQRCDGPVVMDALSFTGNSIPQFLTAASHNQPFNFSYPGIDSPGGCGSNSDYSVRWYANHS